MGELLKQRKEFIRIDDSAHYKRVRVQLHGKGVVLRDRIQGSDLKTKEQQVVRVNELIVAEIDAKVGGIGIVPPDLDGAIVSSHYYLYEIDEEVCLKSWLEWFIRSGKFAEQVAAQGSTNYAAIRPYHVYDYTIPLPPLGEQQRIAARLDAIAARVEEVQRLSNDTTSKFDSLLIQMAHRDDISREHKLALGWREVGLQEVIYQIRDRHLVIPDLSYPNLGIYSFGRGLFKKQPIDGAATSARELYRVKTGQFIYSRLFAFEGAYGVVTDEYDGCYVSGEFPTFECDPEQVRPEFLFAYFKSPKVWRTLLSGSKGLGNRRQRIQPRIILAHRILLPPIEWQERIVAFFRRSDALHGLSSETQRKLNALMPTVLERAFNGGYSQ
jgi:type I restriction enzyme S subunit